jgi:hypothetical protein
MHIFRGGGQGFLSLYNDKLILQLYKEIKYSQELKKSSAMEITINKRTWLASCTNSMFHVLEKMGVKLKLFI